MKRYSELAYFTRRARQSRAAALDAHDVCARDAHRGLAAAYDRLVVAITASILPAASPFWTPTQEARYMRRV